MRRIWSNYILPFIIFLALVSTVVTCNFLVFLHFVELERSELDKAAPITFVNVIVFTILFFVIDYARRRQTLSVPVKRIQEGIDRVIAGDFNTKIKYFYGPDSGNEFDIIITGLNKMIDELSGVETLRTDFIANVSHELKTPLAVIQNYGTLLQNPDLTEEQKKEYGKSITEQTKRLSILITNILKLNKLENQQIYPNVETFNLSEQLCECMLGFEAVWEEKNINIETSLDDSISIKGDRELLSLVWNNLLSNALKFTGEAGTVSLNLYKEGEYACVKIRDTGCGMTPETGKNIFKKFYQGDTSHATKGNGLGLALVKRVMDICDGDISVSSKFGEGSIFTVKLIRELE